MIPNRKALEMVVADLLQEDDARIVVEGDRDAAALMSCGVPKHSIFKAGQKSYAHAENLITYGIRKVIPLFDNDRTGKNKFSLFMRYFSSVGPQVDQSYSIRVRKAGLVCIEDLDNVLS